VLTGATAVPRGSLSRAAGALAAPALLDDTQMTDEEIAESLGFFGSFHFSKRFKQFTGLGPGDYRKRQRQAKASGVDSV